MLDFLVSKEVSNKMQWKMMPRGKDSRPGMAGLFNLLAVFGGSFILMHGIVNDIIH
jgi:hypothetical protein